MSYESSIKCAALELPVTTGRFLITGATGLIGSCMVDVLLSANKMGASFEIFGMSRSGERLKKRFGEPVTPIIQDVVTPVDCTAEYDYIIHCASNADPRKYATNPVETILTNTIGTTNMLEYCKMHPATKMLFTSSFEVYGVLNDISVYREDMSGIINQTVLRNGYPESKRTCELLLKSYVEEYHVNAVIARLPSVYGPTMLESDSKAHAQFIRNALKHEDIVLKSKGEQLRTYCYVIDAVRGLFTVLFKGSAGTAYNIANENSIASISDVAKACAAIAGTSVIYQLPDETEKKGFSKSMNCILDNTRLKSLGWEGKYTLEDGLRETIDYLMQST